MDIDERIAGVAAMLDSDEPRGRAALRALLAEHPEDARLHFLDGSLLAADSRFDEARTAMERAVALAPGWGMVRFRLGFLQFVSGDAAGASATWRDLQPAGPDDPLPVFAAGMQALALDDFGGAIRLLEEGIALNRDNPPLNSDMRLLISEIESKTGAQRTPSDDGDDEPMSLTQLALQQAAARNTRH